jgi:hypothetical protein
LGLAADDVLTPPIVAIGLGLEALGLKALQPLDALEGRRLRGSATRPRGIGHCGRVGHARATF